jgi:glycosyltransferase
MLNISIITAVRNAVGQIGATLRSVESQTYAGIEHVVVDGASSDGTQEYVEKAGRRVSRLVSEPDKGVYDAFNKGLRLATGDVIAFLNAGDTYVEPGVIAKIAARLEETGADLLFADLGVLTQAHSLRNNAGTPHDVHSAARVRAAWRV